MKRIARWLLVWLLVALLPVAAAEVGATKYAKRIASLIDPAQSWPR